GAGGRGGQGGAGAGHRPRARRDALPVGADGRGLSRRGGVPRRRNRRRRRGVRPAGLSAPAPAARGRARVVGARRVVSSGRGRARRLQPGTGGVMTRVLVVAAHPDDELLGLGATVARHVEAGDEVTAVIVSEGATSRYAEGADRALRDAAGAAAAVLGVRDLRFLGMEDQRLDAVPLLDVVRPIEKIRAEIRPDVVYAHHWG